MSYSPTAKADVFDSLELRCSRWRVEPLRIDRVESSFFDDRNRFPPGSAAFDCGLLMRKVEHEWRPAPEVSTDAAPVPSGLARRS